MRIYGQTSAITITSLPYSVSIFLPWLVGWLILQSVSTFPWSLVVLEVVSFPPDGWLLGRRSFKSTRKRDGRNLSSNLKVLFDISATLLTGMFSTVGCKIPKAIPRLVQESSFFYRTCRIAWSFNWNWRTRIAFYVVQLRTCLSL